MGCLLLGAELRPLARFREGNEHGHTYLWPPDRKGALTRLLTPAFIALTLETSPASARQWSAVCSNLSGVRVDDPGAEPTFTQDVLKGASWAYSWNTEYREGNSDPSCLPCL